MPPGALTSRRAEQRSRAEFDPVDGAGGDERTHGRRQPPPDQAGVQSLENQTTGTVDGKHPEIARAAQARVARLQSPPDRREHHLDAETERAVREEAPHAVTVEQPAVPG